MSTMDVYTIKFIDASQKDVVVEADDIDYPGDDWGHIQFFAGTNRDIKLVASYRYDAIFGITRVDGSSS